MLNLGCAGADTSVIARSSLGPTVRIDMEHTTLTWTAFVDDRAGRALLVRGKADRHWESAATHSGLGSESVSVWVDDDGVPVVVEAHVDVKEHGEAGPEAMLEPLLSDVLGPVSLGSPTLWGRVPRWVWFDVTTVWPPLTDAELQAQRRQLRGTLEAAVDRAKRNAR